MTLAHVGAALATALVAFVGGWLAPRWLAVLPEPEREEETAEVDASVAAEDTEPTEPADAGPGRPVKPAAPPVPPKVPYADLAAVPGLAPRLAVAAAVVAGTIGLALGPDPSLPVWTYLAVVGVLLSYVDWRTRLLPFRVVAPSYLVVGGLLAVAALVTSDGAAALRSVISWLVTFAVFWLMWLIYSRGLGYGDVRLSGILGLALGWLGWSELVIGIYAGFVLGAVVGGVLALAKVVDRRGYPFGPFLFAGTWLGAVSGPVVGLWAG